ncbi:MAG: ATP phosphoribosyltransferase [Chloroflexota bacterium]|nr:ATP phosphoribosyltransferase [Chloroflexota bacterium]
MPQRSDIRLALPSKGRLAEDTLNLLANAGMQVYKPNPRQYQATIPSIPDLTVLFQRAGDIAVSVHDGTVDFGITGWDVVAEKSTNGEVLTMHRQLGFGFCTLNVIVSESWTHVQRMSDLNAKQAELSRPLRVATKFPHLTCTFFENHNLGDVNLITAEGTLEIAPTIGYTDLIVDLVSTGTTLQANRLRPLDDGQILASQACLVANRSALKSRPEVLAVARQLLEFIVAHLRAKDNVAVFANIRGETPQFIAKRIFAKDVIGGLQGPTIAPVITRADDNNWHAVNIVVRKDQLAQAITELRSIGGSGVIVTPVAYIFEEEPQAYTDMLEALQMQNAKL